VPTKPHSCAVVLGCNSSRSEPCYPWTPKSQKCSSF
jgi:hypothetical protein